MRDHHEFQDQTPLPHVVEPVIERVDAVRGHPRSAAYVRESHGVHRRRDLGDDLTAALHAWQLLMPNDGSFTGLTSAAVRKWWLPPIPTGTPVFIALGLDDPRPMRMGVRTSRHTRPIAYDDLGGLRCASIPETLMACARVVCLIDLVVMIDCVLHLEQCTVKDIEAVIRPRRPGAKALRRALAHADAASESAYETLLRLLHVLCGIEVQSQYVVRDEDDMTVARADLRIIGTTALPEFDGDEHEKAPRRVKDRRRDRAIERAGHVRRGYTAGDVLHRSGSVLRDAERSLGLPHDPERIRPWLDELRKSLFSSSGQADFLSRTTPRLPERARPGRTA
jgi:very-short-patch-repair endonuclease